MDDWLVTKNFPTHLVAVSGLVRREGMVLLIRSAARGWEFPGGVIEQGEGILDALRREIFEESGIVARPTAFVGIYQNLASKQGYGPLEGTTLPPIVNLSFLCDYVSGRETTSDESLEVAWFPPEEARRLVRFPSYGERLGDMLDFDGSLHVSTFRLPSQTATEIHFRQTVLNRPEGPDAAGEVSL